MAAETANLESIDSVRAPDTPPSDNSESMDSARAPEEPNPSTETDDSGGESMDSIRDLTGDGLDDARKLVTALRAINTMSSNLERTKLKSDKTEVLMRQVGDLRRVNSILVQLVCFLVAWLALATGAVISFVTPESFKAWREGIAIQLIRSDPQTSIVSLHLRRSFGYLCERSFFEVPNTLVVALRSPIQFVFGFLLAVPFAAALRSGLLPSLRHCDDFILAGSILIVANLLFLGDDFSLPFAPLMAKTGGFLLMTSVSILALPLLVRKFHQPRPWSMYRQAILRQLRQEAQTPQVNAGSGLPEPPATAWWTRLAASQLRRRRHATPKEVALVVVANTFIYAIDTLISHD